MAILFLDRYSSWLDGARQIRLPPRGLASNRESRFAAGSSSQDVRAPAEGADNPWILCLRCTRIAP